MLRIGSIPQPLRRLLGRPWHRAAHPVALWRPLKQVRPAHAGRLPDFPLPQYRGRDSQRTVFFDAGQSAASAPVDGVVFLHGLGANLTHWQWVAPPLADTTRVVGLDLPGFGETRPFEGEVTYARLRDLVFGLLDRVGLKRVVVVGHSFGGAIATEMALSAPARVRGLVLLSPAGYYRFPWWVKSGSHVVLHPLFLAPVTVLSAPLVPTQVCRADGPEVDDFTRAVYRPQHAVRMLRNATQTCHAMRRELVERHYVDDVQRLDLPVHTIWGGADRVLNAHASAQTAERLPDGQLTWLDGVGHMPLIEQPDAVIHALKDVLHRVARRYAAPPEALPATPLREPAQAVTRAA